jgi:hypothetical protein
MMEKMIMEKQQTKGPSEAEIQEQLRIFKAGIPFVHIVEAATIFKIGARRICPIF